MDWRPTKIQNCSGATTAIFQGFATQLTAELVGTASGTCTYSWRL